MQWGHSKQGGGHNMSTLLDEFGKFKSVRLLTRRRGEGGKKGQKSLNLVCEQPHVRSLFLVFQLRCLMTFHTKLLGLKMVLLALFCSPTRSYSDLISGFYGFI